MLKAILFDLGDTLFDSGPTNRAQEFAQAGRKTYDYLAEQGHSLPPFNRYYSAHVWGVRWAYVWSIIRRRDFNMYDLLSDVCAGLGLRLDEPTLRELAWQWYSPLVNQTPSHPTSFPRSPSSASAA